ncbi:MAG: hypothetical protein GY710_10395 [Desulfobacteraceae bacterium]|nr:hypothetical protein [Desulfobacteraceae bacterium]
MEINILFKKKLDWDFIRLYICWIIDTSENFKKNARFLLNTAVRMDAKRAVFTLGIGTGGPWRMS